MNFKVYLLIIVSLCSHFTVVSADPHKIFLKEKMEAEAEDPWKHSLVKNLSPEFLEKLRQKNKNFLSADMVNDAGEVKEDSHLVKLGDFVYCQNALIGNGVEGHVYLAQYIPSGGFAAVKTLGFYTNDRVENNSQYQALQNLGRLYGCYLKDNPHESPAKLTTLYFIMPLVMGDTVNDYFSMNLVVDRHKPYQDKLHISVTNNKFIYMNWTVTQGLIQALIDEIEYCEGKGTVDQELNPDNALVTEDQRYVVFMDLIQTSSWLASNAVKVYPNWLRWFQYFLGLKSFLKTSRAEMYDLHEGVVVPASIRTFNERIAKICKSDQHYTLIDLKKDFEELKKGMALESKDQKEN